MQREYIKYILVAIFVVLFIIIAVFVLRGLAPSGYLPGQDLLSFIFNSISRILAPTVP